jgi:hypothetical protein
MKVIAVLATLSALMFVDSVSAQTDASRLLGSWHLTLLVTGPAPRSAGPRAASGEIELELLPSSEPPAGSIEYTVTSDPALNTMFGSQPFGTPRGSLTAGGELELVFNPLVDHGTFYLKGRERGDSMRASGIERITRTMVTEEHSPSFEGIRMLTALKSSAVASCLTSACSWRALQLKGTSDCVDLRSRRS